MQNCDDCEPFVTDNSHFSCMVSYNTFLTPWGHLRGQEHCSGISFVFCDLFSYTKPLSLHKK